MWLSSHRFRQSAWFLLAALLIWGVGERGAWAGQPLAREVEPNGNSATATPIGGTAAVIEGNIYPGLGADQDYYSFTAATGDRIYAAVMTSLSSNASVDSVLTLFASDGTTVLETDLDDGVFGATSSSIAGFNIPSPGTYFLQVRHNAALSGSQLRPYRLYFQQRTGAPTPETEPNDTFPPGQALPAGGWVSGNTSATTDVDAFAVNLNAGDTLYLSLDLDPERDTVEWNGQLGVFGFGTPQLILPANDAGAGTPDSEALFVTVHAAGTYSVLVSIPTGGTTFGTYHLSVTVIPAADEGVNCTTYTSTDVPVAIPTGPGIVTSTITIPGNPVIADLDIPINLTHNFMADLDVQLTAPGGNTVGLFSDIGSVTVGAQTTMDTTLDEEAALPSIFNVVQGFDVADELNYRLSWFDGQPAGGTWTLTLRDDATGDGGTLNGWSMRVCEPVAPPACAPGMVATTVFSTDFESGGAGFTHSGAVDEWELGNPTAVPVTGCNSGTSCWKTDLDGTYEFNSNQDLLSPSISLAGLSAPVVVTWAQKYQIERPDFDHAWLDARQVGMPANAVRLFDWLGADMIDNVGNPIVTVQEAAGWGVHSRRADALAGQNVELFFHLDTDGSVNRGGWGIDDVSVTACRLLSADLSITKTDGVTTAVPGGSVTYTITASNAGTDPVTGATVADTFPAILTCNWTCVGAGGGTCTAAGAGNINDAVNLPAGGSVTYTANCAISASAIGTLTNTASVSSSVPDPTPGNNSATDTDTLTPMADLAITKTDGVTSAAPGGSVTYTITASNAGQSNVSSATVADTFAASLTCSWTCTGAGGGTCTAAGSGNINDAVNLPAGGSVTYSASCTISAAASGMLTNTAMVSSAVTDPNGANNSATDTDTLDPMADLSITKTDGVAAATPGGSVTYTITASNAGPSNATGATVADTFPASLTCNWTCAGAGGGTCTAAGAGNINDVANLPSGGSVTYSASCTISASATVSITNTATVTAPAGTTDPNPGNNSATDIDTLDPTGDLSITKTDGVTSTSPGGSVTYTIIASNAGPGDVPGATVADTFPATLACNWTCVGAGGGTCTAAGAGNINDVVNLPASGNVTYTAICTVSGSASGSITNTVTVTVPAGVTDPNPANNSATDTDTVTTGASVSGTKTASGTFTVGSTVTYTVILTNSGAGAQGDNPGNEFSDLLQPQLALVSASADSGTAVANTGTNTVTWNGPIPPGGTVTITITATILPSAAGTTVTNQGTINYDSNGDGTNDSTTMTDDPGQAGATNPTPIAVPAISQILEVPTLSSVGFLVLASALAAMALALLRRRRQA